MRWARYFLLTTIAIVLSACTGNINNSPAKIYLTSCVTLTWKGMPESTGLNQPGSVSFDGRWVAFSSDNPKYVSGFPYKAGQSEVFIRDTWSGQISVVSSKQDGTPVKDGSSKHPSLSRLGNFIAFSSSSSDLVESDSNGSEDIFIRNIESKMGDLTLVSSDTTGNSAAGGSSNPSISSDGQNVLFISNATNLVTTGEVTSQQNVFIRSVFLSYPKTELISSKDGTTAEEGNGPSTIATGRNVISDDNRYVVFTSSATDLISGSTPTCDQVYVRDRVYDTTTLISSDYSGDPAGEDCGSASISGDGRFVVFESTYGHLNPPFPLEAPNVINDIYLRDRDVSGNGIMDEPGDVKTTLVSMTDSRIALPAGSYAPAGINSHATISRDGNTVLFLSTGLTQNDTTPELDIYIYDRPTETTRLVAISSNLSLQADENLGFPFLSGDGKNLIFTTNATNVLPNHIVTGFNLYKRGPH